jgi:pimeloyl-ACP methyl ester carboxylesterase
MVIDLTRRAVRSGDVELAVFECGDPAAPTVLLVHGWPDTHHLWLGVAQELAGRFHVVTYDTRGMGESEDPGSLDAFTLERLAADVLAVADAVSPHAPVHLVGHDWGSVQGWEAVCDPRAATRIASFVSISGPDLDHMGHWLRRQLTAPSPRSLLRLLRQSAASSYVWFFASPLAPPVLGHAFTADRWRAFLRHTQGVRDADWGVAASLPDDMVRGLRYYRANLGGLRAPRQRRTTVPVLLLVPTRDVAIKPFVHDEVARWAERVERREVPYGHWVALQRPALVAEEVESFIGSLTVEAGA